MILISNFSNAFDQKMAVAMLRVPNGLDYSVPNSTGDDEQAMIQSSYDLAGNTLMHADSDLSMTSGIQRVQSVPTIGTQYSAVDGTNHIVKESSTNFNARDHLKYKKKFAADKVL